MNRNTTHIVTLSLVLGGSLFAHPVRAQPRALVVGMWTDTTPPERIAITIRGTRLVERALRLRGQSVVDTSSLPIAGPRADVGEVSEALQEELHTCIDSAIRAASERRIARARREIARCRTLVSGALDRLLRNDATAKEVLDSCLVIVRTILDGGEGRSEALARTWVCRAEAPDVEPTNRRHTEEVTDLLDEVNDRVRENGGVLIVRHPSEPCQVRVNGRPIGRTPAVRRLAPGTYRIEAECPSSGILRPPPLVVREGTEVEAELRAPIEGLADVHRTELGTLAMVSAGPDSHQPYSYRTPSNISQLLSAANADFMITISVDGQVYRLGSWDRNGGSAGPIQRFPDDARQMSVLATALERLDLPRIGLPVNPTETEETPWPEPAVLGFTFSAIGLGVALGGGATLAYALANPAEDRDRTIRGAGLGLIATGILSLAITEPLWLPRGDAWWTLVPALLGAGAAAAGIGLLAVNGQCPSLPCTPISARYDTASQGAALLLLAAPLLEVPLTYLIREWTGERGPRLAIGLGPAYAHLNLGWILP